MDEATGTGDANTLELQALKDRVRELEQAVRLAVKDREALEQSRARFDALFWDSPLPGGLWERRDGVFRLIKRNRQAGIMASGQAEAFFGESAAEIHPDMPWIPDAFERCLATGRPMVRKTPCRSRFASEAIPFKVHISALPPDCVVMFLEDRSESERALEKLAQSRALNDQTRAAAKAGHWEYDPAAMKGKWSREIYDIFGYEPDGGPVDMSFLLDHIHRDDRERVERDVERSLASEDCYEGEYRVVRKDGDIRHVRSQARILRGEDGTPVWMGGVFQDMTGRRMAEAGARRKEKTLGVLLENLREVFWLRELCCEKILYVSKAYETIWGRPRESLYEDAKSFMDAVVPEDGKRVLDAFTGLRTSGTPFQENYSIIRPDGEKRRIRARAFIVRGKDGDPALVAGLAEDETESWRTQEALRVSEERHKTVVEHSPQAILVVKDGRIVFVNPCGAGILGAPSREDLLGHSVERFYGRDYLETGRRRLENALNGRTNPLMDIELVRLDGRRAILRSVSAPVEYDGARCVLIMGPEVTEARLAEENLRASEQRFRALFEDAPLAYQSLDEQGVILDVNRKWLDVLGYTKEETVGAWIGDFLPPEELEKLRVTFPAFKKQGQIDGKEFSLRRKDGALVLCRFDGRIQRDAYGRFLRTHCIFSDVTEERGRREALERESSLNLAQADIARALTQPGSSIMDVAKVALTRAARITGSAGGLVLTASPRGREAGEKAEAILVDGELADAARECPTLSGPWRFFRAMDASLAEEPLFVNDPGMFPGIRDQASRNEPFVPFLSVPALFEGELYGRIFLTGPAARYGQADLDAIRALADLFAVAVYRARSRERLVAAMEKAEAANKAKSTFLANMSHELRTPLNHVLGCVQLLETTALTEEQAEYARLARQGGRNLTRLLSDILDLARMETGKISLVRAPFSLREALGPVRTVYGDIAGQKGLTLNISVDPSLPETVEGDAVRLRQILLNLVGNAVKFTEAGQVDVVFGMLPHGAPGGVRLYAEIRDTGIGIPDCMLGKVFEPFTQVEDAYTRKYQGAGIGLQIVKRMVKLLGGTMCMVSEPGKGAMAILSIPLGLPCPPAEGEAPAPEGKPRGGRILLVEDDALTAKLITGFLGKLGYASQWAQNGEQALAMLPSGGFDAALMDIQMPVKNGLETAREIRTNPAFAAFARLPLVAMTAYAMRGDKEKFLEAGMDAYLAKPVHLAELERILSFAMVKRDES